MNVTTITYLIYLAISFALTIWVGRTLFKNGQVFLIDVFSGDEKLAGAVNHLLVVGFYLLNFGYVSLALKVGLPLLDATTAIEALSVKIGKVLVVLGILHFLNLFIFSRIRRRAQVENAPLPITPDFQTAVVEG